ncbi:MAG: hypothetical protein U5K79_00405 [Cyclobacteriaceae bacterium]|nr:hypothetical protein [Cyclobacteriaceae bacterium]
MSLRKKNIRLLILLGAFISASLILAVMGNKSFSTVDNKEGFSVQDTSAVDKIIITSANGKVELNRENGAWKINGSYVAEQNMVRVLLAILKDVEAIRNVPKTSAPEVATMIRTSGNAVEIHGNGGLLKSFYAAGNSNKTVSYMMETDSDAPVVVAIPGYENYVAGIFEIPANGWRNRTILNTNYRTLQELTVKYTQFPQYDVRIYNNVDFLNVEGVNRLDTIKMMNYIESFGPLEADRLTDKGAYPRYDSLLNTPFTVTISVKDIQPKNSRTIDFFPLIANDPMMLGYVREDDQMALFEARRIQNYFAVPEEFTAPLK